MRRYIFYLVVSLSAFAIGSFLAFNFYWKAGEKNIYEKTNISIESQPKQNFGRGFGTGFGERRLNEPVYVPKLHKPTCNIKGLLPVWNELIKNKEFKEREKEFYQDADCALMFDVKKVDLNNDGQNEIVFWGNNGNLCGATGNCALWVYEKKGNKYKLLLQSIAYRDGAEEWFEVKNVKTNGYRNLLLKGHFSGYETTHSFYRFNGDRYIETKCWFEIYWMNEEKPSIMTCREYSEETERQLLESEKRLEKQ